MTAESSNVAALSSAERRALLATVLRERADRGGPLIVPATPGQRAIWLRHEMAPAESPYTLVQASRLRGPRRPDVGAMQRMTDLFVARHASLRTTFVQEGGDLHQRIVPTSSVTCELLDASCWSEEEVQAHLKYLARVPFDLARGPLFRIHVLLRPASETILFVAAHHIVTDFWSMTPLVRESLQLLTLGQSDSLPPARSFVDFALWQRNFLRSEEGERQRRFWHEQLGSTLPEMVLPTDHPRPTHSGRPGGICSRRLPPAVTAALRTLCAGQGLTAFVPLLAAYALLLSRYSGQDDLVIGVPAHGRKHPWMEGIIGNLVNLVSVRLDLSGNPEVSTLLERVNQAYLAALAHQDYPFALLVEELQPVRQRGGYPFFSVMFNMLKSQGELLRGVSLSVPEAGVALRLADGTLVQPLSVEEPGSEFDLTLRVEDASSGLHLAWQYNTDLYEPATIEHWLDHYTTLLEGLTTRPRDAVASLPTVTSAERRTLPLYGASLPNDGLPIHRLIAAQAKRRPAAPAVCGGDELLCYAQLEQRSNRLAHGLRRRGVGRGSLVAVGLPRTPELVVTLLAVLKTGAAFVPLEPNHPAQRTARILEDSGASLLITTTTVLRCWSVGRIEVLCLDQHDVTIDTETDLPVETDGTLDDLAYIIYTSGTTGMPKGVETPHGALLNELRAMQREPGIRPEDVLLAVTTVTFDPACLDLFLPLMVGAQVVLAANDVIRDAKRLIAEMEQVQVTVMQATPGLWRMLIDAGWAGKPDLTVLCGGEALARSLADQLLARGRAVWNIYGPTETTIWSTVHRVQADGLPIPLGHPIDNARLLLLDRHRQLAPGGVIGEIYLGGPGLARGYHGRPDLTAERFVPDPFRPGDRLFRTGDLARFRPDGALEYLGRDDSQVKIRGYRIELGEVESALLSLPVVKEATVQVYEDSAGGQHLAAHVVSNDADTTPGALRRMLEPHLPPYMIPTAFVALASLPLTANGKLDRRALPVPDGAALPERAGYVPPTTPLEHLLVELWEEVVDARPIGLRDQFFDLGGHSLQAVRLLSRIDQRMGCRLTVAAFVEDPTIEGLVRVIERQQAVGTSSGTPVEQPGQDPIFLFDATCGAGVYSTQIAQRLQPDRPVQMIHPPGPPTGEAMPSDFEEVVASRLEMVRRRQPHGPYSLVGYRNGGYLALEIARQLQAAGERIDLLALVYSYVPFTFTSRAVRALTTAFRVPPRHGLQFYLALRYLDPRWRRGPRPEGVDLFDSPRWEGDAGRLATRLRDTHQVEAWIVAWWTAGYRPSWYDGRLTVLWASEDWTNNPDPTYGWGRLAREVRVERIGGSHLEIGAHLPELVDRLKAHLPPPLTGGHHKR